MEGSTVLVNPNLIYSFEFITNVILLPNRGFLLKFRQFASISGVRTLADWSNVYDMDEYRLTVFAASTFIQCIYFYFLAFMQSLT